MLRQIKKVKNKRRNLRWNDKQKHQTKKAKDDKTRLGNIWCWIGRHSSDDTWIYIRRKPKDTLNEKEK